MDINPEVDFAIPLAGQISRDLIYFGRLSPETEIFWRVIGYDSDPESESYQTVQKYVRIIEEHFTLPVTGDLVQLINNYRATYYTKDCLEFHSFDFCWLDAVKYGNIDAVITILEKLLPGEHSKYAERGFVSAVQNGHVTIVQLLMPLVSSLTIEHGLITAAYEGHSRILAKLLPSARTHIIEDAYIRACAAGHFEIIQQLVPIITHQHVLGWGFLIAVKNQHLEIIRLFSTKLDAYYFYEAIKLSRNNPDILQIISAMVPIYSLDGFMQLARDGDAERLQQWIPDAIPNHINLALMVAARRNQPHIIQLLLPLTNDQPTLETAYKTVLESRNLEIIRILLPKLQPGTGGRLLLDAVTKRDDELIQFMDPLIGDGDQLRPVLDRIIANGDRQMFKLLLSPACPNLCKLCVQQLSQAEISQILHSLNTMMQQQS